MPLGVNGATPFSSGTNHPTALNHCHRDQSSYDASKQTRVKCTYCGCWARKGMACYQCKQPTGPLVLPRRNGYRVEPLVGAKGFVRSVSASGASSRVAKGAGDLDHFSSSALCPHDDGASSTTASTTFYTPRQAERLAQLSGGRFPAGPSGGADGNASAESTSTSPRQGPHSVAAASSVGIVTGRVSSARPASTVYDDPQRFEHFSAHRAQRLQQQAHDEEEEAALMATAAGSPTVSPQRRSPQQYVGGVAARRYYVPASPRHSSEVFVEQLRGRVLEHQAAEEAQLRRQREALKREEMAAAGGQQHVRAHAQEELLSRVSSSARASHQHNDMSSAYHRSASGSRRKDDGQNSLKGSMKGVAGGYFYHDDQTAVGHKFRDESPYDPAKQVKIKCKYCGCWAKKNMPCSLCRTVNKAIV